MSLILFSMIPVLVEEPVTLDKLDIEAECCSNNPIL